MCKPEKLTYGNWTEREQAQTELTEACKFNIKNNLTQYATTRQVGPVDILPQLRTPQILWQYSQNKQKPPLWLQPVMNTREIIVESNRNLYYQFLLDADSYFRKVDLQTWSSELVWRERLDQIFKQNPIVIRDLYILMSDVIWKMPKIEVSSIRAQKKIAMDMISQLHPNDSKEDLTRLYKEYVEPK